MTEKATQLIRKYEGCSLIAYKCPAGKWTISYGLTQYPDGSPVKEGDKLTDMAEANRMFDLVLEKFEKQVRMILGDTLLVTLPPDSIGALVSFSYNCGITAFAKSTLLKRIRENKLNFDAIEYEFSRWNKSNGKVLSGLTKRRKVEFELYKEGILSQYTKKETYDIGYNNGKNVK